MSTIQKRKLFPDEIDSILNSLPVLKSLPDDINITIHSNLQTKIKQQLEHVIIYPPMIPRLKDEIIYRYNKSLVSPGEMVGMTAAQSIGHNLTQLTLDSFHSAGNITKAVVTGVPKFLKLINASEDTKGDSAIVYFESKPTSLSEIRTLCSNHFICTHFKDLVQEFHIVKNTAKKNWYDIHSQLYGMNYDFEKYEYRIEFKLHSKLLFSRFLSLLDIAKKISEFDDIICIWSDFKTCEIHVLVDISNVDSSLLKTSLNCIELYLEDVVVEELYKVKIAGITGITNIFFNSNNDEWYVETEGSNLIEILHIPGIDTKRTKTNSIWETYKIFGIEAARNVLISEFKDVISSDGTYIHLRHIQLLVDAMTFLGTIHSASRYGITKEQVGPLAKVSFEESLNNFVLAASIGEKESTLGVASAIMCSRIPSIGSGTCELLFDHDKVVSSCISNVQEKSSLSTITEEDEYFEI